LARAFFDDAIARHVLPDDALRARRLPAVYRLHFGVCMRLGTCHTNEGRDGAALWLGPGAYPLSLYQYLRVMPGMTRALGFRNVPRALRVLDHLDRMHPSGRTFWYLAVLGVAPRRQGEGIGRALIQPILRVCDRAGIGAWLETGTERNLSFYAGCGFRVLRESRIPNGPLVWGLWRDPAPG
jgi:GNAT superfamily N-acetyltransferase